MRPAESKNFNPSPGTVPDAGPQPVEIFCQYIELLCPIDFPLERLIDRIEQQRTTPC